MSAFPPQGPGGFAPQGYNPGQQQYSIGAMTRTSGAAITSLIFGLVGWCVPVVGGLIAILTGIIAFGSTRNPAVKGRTMAVIGLILGLLSVICYGSLTAFFITIMHKSGPTHDFAQRYITELSAGNEAAATDDTTADSAPQVPIEIAQMSSFGTITGTSILAIDFQDKHSAVGSANFSSGRPRSFKIDFKIEPDGKYKVENFQWTN